VRRDSTSVVAGFQQKMANFTATALQQTTLIIRDRQHPQGEAGYSCGRLRSFVLG
jgi:hypothetical protein